MLDAEGIDYRYRETRDEPLSEAELRRLLKLLGRSASELLRRRDRAYKELGLTGDEPEEALITAMSRYPTLLQRPIGVAGQRAVIGRPPENLLALAG